MTFKQAIRAGIDGATNFDDRATRAEFWWWALLVALVATGAFVLSEILVFSGILAYFFLVLLLVPTAAVSVRRLHDLDRPWTVLLWALVPLLGWAYVLMLFTEPGDPASNQYGWR